MDVVVRAKRILGPMERFRFLDEPPKDNEIEALMEGEVYIGVYENDDGGSRDSIFITNRGMLIRSSEPDKHVLFGEIADIRFPSDKQDDCTIWLVLVDGAEVSFEVEGTRGRFRDVFEFTRFLDRVVSDAVS